MTAAKLADNSSTSQTSYFSKQNSSHFIRFAENTACKLNKPYTSAYIETGGF